MAANEAIAAGQLMGIPQLCLVHTQLTGPGLVEVTVRTMDVGFTATVLALAGTALQ